MLLITIVLYTKNLSGAKILKYENVMKIVVKTINFIRSRGLNHRQFKTFLIELNSRYSEVIYFSEVRWLSRGIVLQRFFELRNEIDLFMKAKGRSVSEISDINWICDLAFLADITSHLNELNLKLQGKDRFVTELYDYIKAFQLKLILFKSQIISKHFSHFKCCKTISGENNKIGLNINKYLSSLESLETEFNERFNDFKNYKFNFALFTNPFAIEISDAPNYIQMELIELQCDSLLKSKYSQNDVKEFYSFLPQRYQLIKKNALQVMSMFGSTYMCEQLFSIMKINKNELRSNLTDEHLNSILKINSTHLNFDINALVSQKRCQISSKK